MSFKGKKHIFMPLAFLIYLLIMAIIAYPSYKTSGNWGEFFVILGVSLLSIVLLFFILKRKQKKKDLLK